MKKQREHVENANLTTEQRDHVENVKNCAKKQFNCDGVQKCAHNPQDKSCHVCTTTSESPTEGSQDFYESMDIAEKLKVENYVEKNKIKVFERFTELCNNGEPPTKLQDDKVKMTEQNEAEIWANCFKQINVGR